MKFVNFTDFSVGFINKIKKLLECVCHNCGKILADEVSRPWGMTAFVVCSC